MGDAGTLTFWGQAGSGVVGSFEPRKFPLKEAEQFEDKGIYYSVKDKNNFKKR